MKGTIGIKRFSCAIHAQLAERVAESAMSGVGKVADEAGCVCGVAEATIAEARFVHGEVESRVALLAAQADASTAHIVDVLSQCVQEVAEHSDAQVSQVAGEVSQQLEKGLETVVTSAAVTLEHQT